MRQIFVVERIDRQPFTLTVKNQKVAAQSSDQLMVLGVGFPAIEAAETFLHETLNANHETFTVIPLVEGPVPPIFSEPLDPTQAN